MLLAVLAACARSPDGPSDQDGDGVPDPDDCAPLDAGIGPGFPEVCDGEDNDCDGAADEDFDQDADGVGDCFEEELCDGVDNDVDGQVDEDTDADGDGLGDCFDAEGCDGLDNDGDGEVDEGFDVDLDGVPDCADEETCDGLDNDGDALVDEGFGDADGDEVADCVDEEGCDGVDNDGDALVDEGFDVDGDGVADCGPCPSVVEVSTCTVDLSDGSHACTGDDPIALVDAFLGYVYRIDLAEWQVLTVEMHVTDPTGFVWNLGNSPSNNGSGGDAGDFENDGEAQADGAGLVCIDGDTGGSAVLFQVPNPVSDPAGDDVVLELCDGRLSYASSLVAVAAQGSTVFQVGGDEPDLEATSGVNDTVVWFAVGRTVQYTSGRTGAGVDSLVISLGR